MNSGAQSDLDLIRLGFILNTPSSQQKKYHEYLSAEYAVGLLIF